MNPTLLECFRAILAELADPERVTDCPLSPEPCRVAVYPGGEVAWDSCETLGCGSGKNGQLWVAAQPAIVTEQGGGCRRIQWTAEIGIVRCASGVVRDDGSPPRVADVEADAAQQAADSAAIMRAVTTRWPGKPECLEGVGLVAWQPLGPNGGCVGGSWTIRGVLDECC